MALFASFFCNSWSLFFNSSTTALFGTLSSLDLTKMVLRRGRWYKTSSIIFIHGNGRYLIFHIVFIHFVVFSMLLIFIFTWFILQISDRLFQEQSCGLIFVITRIFIFKMIPMILHIRKPSEDFGRHFVRFHLCVICLVIFTLMFLINFLDDLNLSWFKLL